MWAQLKLLGKHNVLNATAAIAVCLNLVVSQQIIKKSLKKFSGVQRRMTKIFTKNKNDFYDDYAHHPTEIKSILEGVKNVYNEMYLGSSQTFSERADDLLFETRIKNRLLFESGIYSNNYSVDVVNGNVYVMGTASNFDEKTKLENFLREMKDIKKLITIVSLPKKIQNDKNYNNEKKNKK